MRREQIKLKDLPSNRAEEAMLLIARMIELESLAPPLKVVIMDCDEMLVVEGTFDPDLKMEKDVMDRLAEAQLPLAFTVTDAMETDAMEEVCEGTISRNLVQ